jgi:hypothetical protein
MVFPDKIFSKSSKWSLKKLEIKFSQNLATSVHYFHKNPSHGLSSHWNSFFAKWPKLRSPKEKKQTKQAASNTDLQHGIDSSW